MNRRATALSILYPFLLAAYPTLHLLAANQGQIPLSAGTRSLAVSLLLAGIVLGVSLLVLRNVPRAALVTAIVLVFLFSYGHVYEGLKTAGLSGITLVRHRYLVPLWGLLLAAAIVAVLKARISPRLGDFGTILTLAVLALPLAQIAAGAARAHASRVQDPEAQACSLPPLGDSPAPDIYLIIMDSYERADILQEMHGYDNGPFLEQLRQRGFYVAEGSLSNYRFTALSLASLLNMDYIQSFPDRYSPDRDYAWGIAQLIPDNRLRRELECIGYTTVAIESGTQWTEWEDADFFLKMEPGLFGDLRLLGSVTEFESVLADTTLARAALDGLRNRRAATMPADLDPASQHRELILYEFDQLMEAPQLSSPKLVYAHILAPHFPIVFGRNGESLSEGDFKATPSQNGDKLGAYADEVAYLNLRLVQIVDRILEESEAPPVIVIMGDHGWADRTHEDKLSILNAIYLPGGAEGTLNATITPVNTFRVVLSRYLGGDFDLLPDVSYYSPLPGMFQFEAVPNTWAESE